MEPPLKPQVIYEELAAAPEQIGRNVLAVLGFKPRPGGRVEIPPELTHQGDGVNAAWTAQYRLLAGFDTG